MFSAVDSLSSPASSLAGLLSGNTPRAPAAPAAPADPDPPLGKCQPNLSTSIVPYRRFVAALATVPTTFGSRGASAPRHALSAPSRSSSPGPGPGPHNAPDRRVEAAAAAKAPTRGRGGGRPCRCGAGYARGGAGQCPQVAPRHARAPPHALRHSSGPRPAHLCSCSDGRAPCCWQRAAVCDGHAAVCSSCWSDCPAPAPAPASSPSRAGPGGRATSTPLVGAGFCPSAPPLAPRSTATAATAASLSSGIAIVCLLKPVCPPPCSLCPVVCPAVVRCGFERSFAVRKHPRLEARHHSPQGG
jgi:hypothetical protein